MNYYMGRTLHEELEDSLEIEDMVVGYRSSGMLESRNQLARLMRDASRRANLFDNDEVWVNSEGRYIPIEEISARYAENIMRHLESQSMEDAEMVYIWNTRNDPNATPFNYTEEAAREWLRNTNLYRAVEKASARPF